MMIKIIKRCKIAKRRMYQKKQAAVKLELLCSRWRANEPVCTVMQPQSLGQEQLPVELNNKY